MDGNSKFKAVRHNCMQIFRNAIKKYLPGVISKHSLGNCSLAYIRNILLTSAWEVVGRRNDFFQL